MDPNVSKVALSGGASPDAHGSTPGAPETKKSEMEILPTRSAADLKPAVEIRETKIKKPEVPHGNSGNRGMDTRMEDGDSRVEDGHKPAAHVEPVEELVEKTAQSSIAEETTEEPMESEASNENPSATAGSSRPKPAGSLEDGPKPAAKLPSRGLEDQLALNWTKKIR